MRSRRIAATQAQLELWLAHRKVNPPINATSSLPGFDGEALSLIVSSSPPRFLPVAPYRCWTASAATFHTHTLTHTQPARERLVCLLH